ncbi:hypothetical protein EOE66_02370 [Rubrivivax rivuli]|uniref:Uncharacterized protein n=2 Tax=Rubrivivax rivuli TaxID=1862385 RepID=A0A437RSY2_9BURK|nr:hypothetical protein EOE66_02370 [Rubrivivax rivuli]
MWRSAGWPCHDAIELDLLAAGLLERRWDAAERETLRVTDAGLQRLAEARQRHQAAYTEHEALVARVAREMQRAGRIAWRGLSLRAPLRAEPAELAPPAHNGGGIETATAAAPARSPTVWAVAMPDVYSIRHTTVEDHVEPIAHEIKVRRADLLSDLRRPEKAAAYLAVSSQCWYVLREGIAESDEVPPAYGVMFASASGLVVARPAPRRAMRLPLAVWMALAKAHPEPHDESEGSAWLADTATPGG